MGKFRIMCSIFWSEKFKRFYMAIFVLLIIVTSNTSISLLKEEYDLRSIGEQCDFDDAVYFSKADSILPTGDEAGYETKINHLFEKMEQGGHPVGRITYLYTYIDALEENAFICDYNEAIIARIELPLSEGKWFQEGGDNEVILSYDYKNKYRLGEVIDLEVNGKDGSPRKVSVKVIGFLEKSNYMMNFMSSGYVDISDLLTQNKSSIITNGLYTSDGEHCAFRDNTGVMIFNMPVDKKEMDNIYAKFTEFGAVTSVQEIADVYFKNTEDRFRSQFGLEIVLLILAVSGLGSMNFISLYTKRKEYGVYFICGLPGKTAVWMTAFINVFVVLLAFIPTMLFYLFKPDAIPNFDLTNILITLGIIMFILFVTFIPFYFITKKDSIINLTRR